MIVKTFIISYMFLNRLERRLCASSRFLVNYDEGSHWLVMCQLGPYLYYFYD